MNTPNLYIIWDFWSDENTCYAIYEKEEKLYFSEASKEERDLLVKKIQESYIFKGFIKRLLKKLLKRKK